MKTFLRWCAILVLSVVLLVGAVYVVHGLVGAAAVADAKQDAAAEVAAALPASRQQAVRDRDELLPAIVAEWGEPAYSWQELVCDIDSSEAGWVVQTYTQECRVHSIDLIPVAGAGITECDPWFPRTAPRRRSDAVPTSLVDVRRGPSTALGKSHPHQGCPGGIVGPTTHGASRLLGGGKPEGLDQSPAWVVVTIETQVSDTDLGCDPWTVVLCSEPVDRPALGDLD